jgi:hypothetical protein
MLTALARWMLQFRLFQRRGGPRSPRNIIIWWEARRIPYNAIVALAGVLAGLLIVGNAYVTERVVGEPIGLPDPPLFAIFAVVTYGVILNVCFTGGWIAELLSRRVWGDRVDAFGEVAFTVGTIFSVLLTLMPAALLVVVGVLAMAFHSRTVASEVWECPLPPGAQIASFPSELPVPVLKDFQSHVPTLAGIGRQFNATDVVSGNRPSRRLIFVKHLGPKWAIAYEHGGFAYHDHLVVYELSVDGAAARLVFNIIASPETVCTAGSSWLIGDASSAALADGIAGHW